MLGTRGGLAQTRRPRQVPREPASPGPRVHWQEGGQWVCSTELAPDHPSTRPMFLTPQVSAESQNLEPGPQACKHLCRYLAPPTAGRGMGALVPG